MNYLVNQLQEIRLNKKDIPAKLNDEETENRLEQIDQVVIRLAFCDAVAEVMREYIQQALQNTIQVDMDVISNMEKAVKECNADSSFPSVINQINNSVPSSVAHFEVPDDVKQRMLQIEESKLEI